MPKENTRKTWNLETLRISNLTLSQVFKMKPKIIFGQPTTKTCLRMRWKDDRKCKSRKHMRQPRVRYLISKLCTTKCKHVLISKPFKVKAQRLCIYAWARVYMNRTSVLANHFIQIDSKLVLQTNTQKHTFGYIAKQFCILSAPCIKLYNFKFLMDGSFSRSVFNHQITYVHPLFGIIKIV